MYLKPDLHSDGKMVNYKRNFMINGRKIGQACFARSMERARVIQIVEEAEIIQKADEMKYNRSNTDN